MTNRVMMTMMITASDACNEGLQRASNARELRASRSVKKHCRVECMFCSLSKPRGVLKAVFAFSFSVEILHVPFFY